MKHVCLALLCLLCTACTRFENPIVGEQGPALDEALIGHWAAEKDGSRLEIVITRDGEEGKLAFAATEPGKEPETGVTRLITARIERHDFGSVLDAGDGGSSWRYFRYELATANRLTIYPDDDAFWTRAVNDKLVTGTVAGTQVRTATITASSDELRALVQGYGAVIFKDEPVAELTRE
jgi:hypothetical protein